VFHRENNVLRRGTGVAVEGATITVYVTGTDTAGDYTAATKATIYPTNVVGVAIAGSVLTSDENGHYEYYAPDGVYDEVLTYGSITEADVYIQMFDLSAFESSSAADAAAAAASAVAAGGSAVNSAASAAAAATSATNAGNSATASAASAVTAGAARDAAVTAELASEAAANASETSRSGSAVSETNAAASAASITGMLDTDVNLAANSDAKIATQKATKAYADGKQASSANLTTFAGIAPSANVQSVLGAADYAAIRTLLGLAFRGCRNSLTATFALSATTDTPISFAQADEYDTDSIHDNTSAAGTPKTDAKFVVPAGVTKVRICCGVGITAPVLASRHQITLMKNNATAHGKDSANSAGGTEAVGMCIDSGVLSVVAGDYFCMNLYSTSAQTVGVGTTFFAMEIVA
jgi:hypothetical protein